MIKTKDISKVKYVVDGEFFKTKADIIRCCQQLMEETGKGEYLSSKAQIFFQDLMTHHDGLKYKVKEHTYRLKKDWVGEGPGQKTWGLRIYSLEGFPGDSISWHHAIRCMKPNTNAEEFVDRICSV